MSRPGTGRRIDIRRSMIYEGALWTPASIPLTRIATFEGQHTDSGSGTANAWIDQVAAKNATQGTPADKPAIITLNSNEILDFDGTSDYLFTSPSTVINTGNVTTFAFIGNIDTLSGIDKIVETGTAGAGSFAIFQESAKLSVYAGGAAGQDYVAGNTTLVAGTRYLFIVEIPWSTLTTAEIKSWVNNTLQTQTVVGNTATNTTAATKTWIIGRWISAGAQFWDGKMDLLDAWDGSFTATDRDNFYTYAKAKYGVA